MINLETGLENLKMNQNVFVSSVKLVYSVRLKSNQAVINRLILLFCVKLSTLRQNSLVRL